MGQEQELRQILLRLDQALKEQLPSLDKQATAIERWRSENTQLREVRVGDADGH